MFIPFSQSNNLRPGNLHQCAQLKKRYLGRSWWLQCNWYEDDGGGCFINQTSFTCAGLTQVFAKIFQGLWPYKTSMTGQTTAASVCGLMCAYTSRFCPFDKMDATADFQQHCKIFWLWCFLFQLRLNWMLSSCLFRLLNQRKWLNIFYHGHLPPVGVRPMTKQRKPEYNWIGYAKISQHSNWKRQETLF